jgi:hypothetical protein
VWFDVSIQCSFTFGGVGERRGIWEGVRENVGVEGGVLVERLPATVEARPLRALTMGVSVHSVAHLAVRNPGETMGEGEGRMVS